MYNTFINGVQHVWLGISIFLLLILSFSRTTIFKNALTEILIEDAWFYLRFSSPPWPFQEPTGVSAPGAVLLIFAL